MNPIIPIWLVYLSGVCDGIKDFLNALGIIALIASALALFFITIFSEWSNICTKCIKYVCIPAVISLFISVLIPNQKTVYTIMVASQITPQNIQLVGGTVKDTVDYMFEKTEDLIEKMKEEPDKKK